ncbi:MAG: hypothetical protein EHM70_17450 [Chloroflexota bacterium]|nr:MAG: hypothetical protein EHM70_17450 [Chloroflexota bacterium]
METGNFPRLVTPEQAELLDMLQRNTFQYFLDLANPNNGLIADSNWEAAPSSIAAVGFGLPCYAVGAERGWIAREEAVERALAAVRFFRSSPQGPEPEASGYQGFYYHFLDMASGQRHWQCELSTIDTAILLSGMLAIARYFDRDSPGEQEIRQTVDQLYERVNWNWAENHGDTVSYGWKPETGFLEQRWQGYDESLLLYVLGLGAPQYRLPDASYPAFTSTYRWEKHYGYEFVYAAPLFIHHFSQVWIDFRGLQDEFMRARGIDYFENTRRATYAHRQYAIENPRQFVDYGENSWGITASEGPVQGADQVELDGKAFYGYLARGIPEPDDGTLSPWTAITSLPFAPEIALPAVVHYWQTYPQLRGKYGMKCSLNPSFSGSSPAGWFSDHYYGINEGPLILMIENFRNGFVWRLMEKCANIHDGLKRAGFQGGFLGGDHA